MTKLQGNKSNNTALIMGTLIAVALIALALFAGRGQNSAAQANTASGAAVKANFDLTNKPMVGQETAPVEMIVVEDFKCPACKQFEATVFPKVENEYVSTGKVKVYSVAWPFLAELQRLEEDDSKYAAQAGECAYDNGGAEAF
ncbi:MAG: thioredoxin domain-containing protein, partial [Deinococcus sp.]|nr:thioredoxin domain-containing protein [Deinococcus sp.]